MIKSLKFTFFLIILGIIGFAGGLSAQERDTTLQEESEVPTISLTEDMLDDEFQQEQVSGLLYSRGDLFSSITRYHFFAARFQRRGYDAKNSTVMINGISMNDVELGQPIWSYWGGLNDITRYAESRMGVSASRYGFGTISGYSNIEVRASEKRKGTRASYALTNRSYRHRFMATHATGMMDNGWALATSGSRRYAKAGYAPGTFYDAWSYFLSVEKKLNDKHSIGFVGMGAPRERGKQGGARQEVFDLVGSNYYNPYWGYQNDKKRNSRVSKSHKPIMMLTHYWKMDEETHLNTSLYGQFGRFGETRLNWYDAKDPRPDYYRYLPSYYEAENNEQKADQLRQRWENDPDTRQIDWEQLYFANRKNLYTVEDANGEKGNDLTGNRAKYIIEEERNDSYVFGLNSEFNKSISSKLDLAAGIQAVKYKSKNFKELVDLLGADYWVDIDQFAERDFDSDSVAQNNLDNPNGIIKEGDKFSYEYDLNIHKADLFAQAEYKMKIADVYAGILFNYTNFWRFGHNRNGRFPKRSYGKSETQHFVNYGAKVGGEIKLSGRHILSVNGLYRTKTPQIRYSYLSPRINDALVPGLTNEKILTGDIGYHVRYPKFKSMVALYYTQVNDQVWARPFYHDELRTFVNYSMSDVDKLYTGVEAAVQYNVIPQLTLSAAGTKQMSLWNSEPKATITQNNSSEVLAENRTVYLKNYPIGGMPQTAATFGAKYNGADYWFAGANISYFTDMYLPLNPDRRTEEALDKYVKSDPQWDKMIAPTKLNDGFTVDVVGGKSFKIKEMYLSLFVSVSNVLNNQDYISGGYEQLRYDPNDIDRFPPKYWYMYGRNYYLMTTLRF